MTGAADGYVTDLAYPAMFHRETGPVWIMSTVAAIGQQAPRLDGAFRYLDLGCGVGLNVALLAAANPGGAFLGIDGNPEHVARGRPFMDVLPNLRLIRARIEDVARAPRDAGLGDGPFDFIALHGVYSWVSPETRAAVRRLVAGLLAPGGHVYLHYTSHPGHSVLAGAQAMLRRIGEIAPGDSAARLASGLACIRALKAGGAGYLRAHPAVGRLLLSGGESAAYLAHDLLARDWAALHVGDVIEEMEGAGCAFVGSAAVLENVDALSVPGAVRPLIARIGEVKARETARDLARNQSMRRDLYRRGLRGLAPDAYRAQLSGLCYHALPAMQTAGPLTIATTIGPVSVDAAVVDPIRRRLAPGPARFAELAGLPGLAGDAAMVLRALQMLAAAGEIHAAAPGHGDPAAAHALNRLLAREGDGPGWLAAPAIGSAIPLDGAQMAVAGALLDDPALDGRALAHAAAARRPGLDAATVARLAAGIVPVWKRLGVVPA